MKITVDSDLCCGSSECIKICPLQAISLVNGKAVIDHDLCDLDGLCIPACPKGAIGYDEGEIGGCGF